MKGNIRDVLNQRNQFSAISGNRDAYGSVQAIPNSAIKQEVKSAVLNHLQNRANGGASSIGGHVNYINPIPKKVSAATMKIWGNAVVEDAKKSGLYFGVHPYTHYHGTAPRASKAGEFNVHIPESFFTDE